MSHECQQPLGAGNRKEADCPLASPEGTETCLESSPVRPTLNFLHPER